MRPRTVRRFGAGCVAAWLLLAGCASGDAAREKEVLEPYPIVLSAQEVGPGYALTGNDFSLMKSMCSPQTSYPPFRNDHHYIAQYTNGARVVAVGIWPTDG
ncbi:hypothetical protein, partial [Schaalia canis]|uniref:hypothetical protein n=1 Tax=Schaalia canis TaxID=100469 RepID=UPI00196AF57D